MKAFDLNSVYDASEECSPMFLGGIEDDHGKGTRMYHDGGIRDLGGIVEGDQMDPHGVSISEGTMVFGDNKVDPRMLPQKPGINLVVDLSSCMEDDDTKVVNTSVGGSLCPGDMVWGKVKSHPWWPGQIVEPSAASEKAMSHKKKNSMLISYFGDESFAWIEASKIRPFVENFAKMSVQSDNEVFRAAVDDALVELSRRVEAGLACPCRPEDVLAKIKFPEASRNSSLQARDVLGFLQSLAVSPEADHDRLKLATARGQLSAFYKQKGYGLLDMQISGGELVEEDVVEGDFFEQLIDVPLDSGEDYVAQYGPSGLHSNEPSFQSCESGEKADTPMEPAVPQLDLFQNAADIQKKPASSSVPQLDLTSSSSESEVMAVSQNVVEPAPSVVDPAPSVVEPAPSVVEPAPSVVDPAPSVVDPVPSVVDPAPSVVEPAPSVVVPVRRGRGRPRKAAADPPREAKKRRLDLDIVPESNPSFQNGSEKVAERRGRGRPRKPDCPPGEVLSRLQAAAASPMEGGYSILTPVAGHLRNFRNSIALELSKNKETMPSSEQAAESEAMQAKDKAAEAYEEYQKARAEKEAASKRAHEAYEAYKRERAAKEAAEGYCPTGLVFTFLTLDSLPPIPKLHEIYSKFGPLEESATLVLRKAKRLRLVFKKECDALRAFSASGKFAIFGPALESYKLDYEPLMETSEPAKPEKKKKKKAT